MGSCARGNWRAFVPSQTISVAGTTGVEGLPMTVHSPLQAMGSHAFMQVARDGDVLDLEVSSPVL